MSRATRRSTDEPFGLALWIAGVLIGALLGTLATVLVGLSTGALK